MFKIEEGIKAGKSNLKNIDLSLLFFILGTGFGTAVILYLPQLITCSIVIPKEKVSFPFPVLLF
jgi:hypothetical protein